MVPGFSEVIFFWGEIIENILFEWYNVKTDKESTVSFAKQQNKLITKEDEEKLHYGLMIHKVLEFTDFKNINDDILNGKEKEIISDFLDNINIENSKNIYK